MPVVVDLPKDTQNPALKFPYHLPRDIKLRSYHPTVKGHCRQIKKALEVLLAAKRPILYAGGGVILSDAADKLTQLAKRVNSPVTTTLMGLGAFPATDKQSVGMLGMHGTYEANMSGLYSNK